MICLSILMQLNIKSSKTDLYFIDSTKIAVCWNKRIFKHKVAKWIVQRWKSSMWWFYWFKLHIITDEKWNLLKMKITPWNVDDRNPVLSMCKKLKWLLVWDAWYISEKLREKLYKQWLQFLTWVKKNMKKIMTKWQHKLLKTLQMVETAFSVQKWSYDLVSSLARSIYGHFARIVYSLLGYTIWKNLNNPYLSIS